MRNFLWHLLLFCTYTSIFHASSSCGTGQLETQGITLPLRVPTKITAQLGNCTGEHQHENRTHDCDDCGNNGTNSGPTTADMEAHIYFGTISDDGGGAIIGYSKLTSDVRTLVTGSGIQGGLTFDWINRKFYYGLSYPGAIYAANEDGTGVQAVFHSTEYGHISGLAFDWISRNLCGVARNGFVFVCRLSSRTDELKCSTLLKRQGTIMGITVDPINGQLYWTRWLNFTHPVEGDIVRARMDGSDSAQIVSGLNGPLGITIDYAASRLFWTEYDGNKICSSNLDGTDVRTIVVLPSETGPFGIALLNNKIYWGNREAQSLQRSSKSGHDIHTVFNGTRPIQHLATSSRDFPTTRRNHCEGQNCADVVLICIALSASFRNTLGKSELN